ncbi:hypothetical protein HMPREF9552_02411, partial [Escherichia coli MS 198-1]
VLIHACGMWEVCWILLFLLFFVFVFISLFDCYRAIKWCGIQPALHCLFLQSHVKGELYSRHEKQGIDDVKVTKNHKWFIMRNALLFRRLLCI